MILSIDTSTRELLVALSSKTGEVLGCVRREAVEGERGIHDARLASQVKALLDEQGQPARSIERIALVIGPGSFTGLRIGLSFAKGLAFATGAALVPVTQHECLAREVVGEVDAIVTEGYRSGLYYVAQAAMPYSVELVTDLSGLEGKRILAHVAMLGSVPAELSDCSFGAITPESLTKLAFEGRSLIRGEALDRLDPLYVTDFSPSLK